MKRTRIHTKSSLAKLAKQFSQRSHFQKHQGGAYVTAGKMGILDEICKHMGAPKNKPYTIEELIEEASKYGSRSEFESKNKKMYSAVINRKLGPIVFKNLPSLKRDSYTYEELLQKFSSCYSLTHFYHVHGRKTALAAKRMGVFEELKKQFNPKIPTQYNSIDIIKEVAIQYSLFKTFKDKEHLAYLSAQRLNILQDIKQLLKKPYVYKKSKYIPKMKRIKQKQLDEELIISISTKYKTLKDFKINEPEIYKLAKRKQLLLKCLSKTMLFPRSQYSIEDIFNIAKKYNTIGEFLKTKRHIYHLAKEYGILKDICTHMERLTREKYTDQELIDFAKKFKFRDDVRIARSGIYTAILDRNLAEVAFKHMPPKRFGKMEAEVRNFVSKYFKCHKHRENVKISDKKYIKRFEIDIFIPELNKGIEFDGTYWHSPTILKQRRPHWPEEDLINYESIKDSYFKTKGIEILHIKEKDWIENETKCKNKILSFLKTIS